MTLPPKSTKGRPKHTSARYQYYASHAHLTKTEMAKELNIARSDVSRDLKRYQLSAAPEAFPRIDEQKAELIRRNFRKLRYVLLAQMVGVQVISLKHFMQREGLKKQPQKSHRKFKQAA